MRGVAHLALRSVLHHRWRSGLIVSAVGLSVLLPLVVSGLVDRYQQELERRAADTPLVVGAKGSRYDLVLSSLYFEGRVPAPLPYAELQRVRDSGFAEAAPIHVGQRAVGRQGDEQGYAVVGTSLEYYRRRGLRLAEGSWPELLGDALLGSRVAEEMQLAPGGSLLTRTGNVHVFSGEYPLRMNVVGVLAESGGPDDGAVFVDLPTVWLALGLGHGHDPAELQEPDAVLRREPGGIVLNDKVYEFTQVTAENLDSFHFHGEEGELPITAVLAWPLDSPGRTKLKGRYVRSDGAQILVPTEVVGELVGFVFRLKRFFDANTVSVLLATGLFLVVIVLLSVQVRERERQTLHRMGCPRGLVARLFALEVVVLVGGGASLALLASWGVSRWLGGGLIS